MAGNGKRRAHLSSLRDAAARWLLVLLLVCVAVGAALLHAQLPALVAGFVATALVVDYIFPVTGFLHIDSRHAFQRLVWQRRRKALGNWRPWRRDHGHLEVLAFELEARAGRHNLGLQTIAIDSIIGTVEAEKAIAFDGAFRPPSWSRGRWELMWIACRRGESLPPISVYRLHGRHFVVDGHHRVSVARSLEAVSIDAEVIELLPFGSSPQHAEPTAEITAPGALVEDAPVTHTIGRARSSVSPDATEGKAWASRGLLTVVLFLAVGLALTLLSSAFGPGLGYVLIVAACILIGRGLGTPVQTGLKHHHQ